MKFPDFNFKSILLGYSIPAILGLVAFFIVAGPKVLEVQNIAWLQGLDPQQHYIGWAFFRNGPWTFPVGLNPEYGLQISSAIVFSDSLPILAIPFKFLRGFLPSTFQYLGLWTALCLVLQACCTWLIAGMWLKNAWQKIGLCVLMLFAPPLLWRIGEHTALLAHFLILLAIFGNLRVTQNARQFFWVILIASAALIHFYLLVMVLALWFSDVLDRLYSKKLACDKKVISEIGLVLAGLMLTLWQAGYFSVGGASVISTGSYGIGRLNLLAPLTSEGWSYFLPDIPNAIAKPSDAILARIEGYNYFGLGLIVLCVLACLAFIFSEKNAYRDLRLQVKRHPVYIVSCVALTLFAISNHIGIGAYAIHIPLPEVVVQFASILRASARLFWPVFYSLVLLATYILSKRLSIKYSAYLFFLLAGLQILDTSPGWLALRAKLTVPAASTWSTQLKSVFWGEAANQYHKIVQVPVSNKPWPNRWQELNQYALEHDMGTSIAFLSRINPEKRQLLNKQFNNVIASGNYDADTLYILDDEKVLPALRRLHPEDVLMKIDGLIILAPRWAVCQNCFKPAMNQRLLMTIPRVQMHEVISFRKGGSGAPYLVQVGVQDQMDLGWAYPEDFGVWLAGERAKMTLLLPANADPKELTLNLRALIGPGRPFQELEIYADGVLRYRGKLDSVENNRITIGLTQQERDNDFMSLEFVPLSRMQPKQLGIGQDTRQLSVGLVSARFD